MNVNGTTHHKPSRCSDSITLTDHFVLDSLSLIGDIGALARLRIVARERDKYLIIKAQQAKDA